MKDFREYLFAEYTADPTMATIGRLSGELKRSPRSIIQILAAAKLYVKPVRTKKSGDIIITREQMTKDIGSWMGIEIPSLAQTKWDDLRKLHLAMQNPDNLRAHLVDLEAEQPD